MGEGENSAETFEVTLAGDAVEDTDYSVTGAADLTAVEDGTTLTIKALEAITVNGTPVAKGDTTTVEVTGDVTITINKDEATTFEVTLAGDAVEDTDYSVTGAADLTAVEDGTTLTIEALEAITVNGTPVAKGDTTTVEVTGDVTITINKQ